MVPIRLQLLRAHMSHCGYCKASRYLRVGDPLVIFTRGRKCKQEQQEQTSSDQGMRRRVPQNKFQEETVQLDSAFLGTENGVSTCDTVFLTYENDESNDGKEAPRRLQDAPIELGPAVRSELQHHTLGIADAALTLLSSVGATSPVIFFDLQVLQYQVAEVNTNSVAY